MTNTETVELDIHGMHCGSCALLIDDALIDLPGVITSQTSHKNARATLTVNPATIDHNQILTTIHDLGYQTTKP
ncbi:MAG: cation transporter [Pseudonocardia sp.]